MGTGLGVERQALAATRTLFTITPLHIGNMCEKASAPADFLQPHPFATRPAGTQQAEALTARESPEKLRCTGT